MKKIGLILLMFTVFSCSNEVKHFTNYGDTWQDVYEEWEFDTEMAEWDKAIFFDDVMRELSYKMLLIDVNPQVYVDNPTDITLNFPDEVIRVSSTNKADFVIQITEEDLDPKNPEVKYTIEYIIDDASQKKYTFEISKKGRQIQIDTYFTYVTERNLRILINNQWGRE